MSKPGSDGWRGASAGAASAMAEPGSPPCGASSGVGLADGSGRFGRSVVQLGLDAAHPFLDVVRGRFHRRLELLRGALHLFLKLAQFVELHFAADVRLHVGDIPLQAPEQQAHRARGLGQALGADHHQRHHADEDDFGKAYVKHAPMNFLD